MNYSLYIYKQPISESSWSGEDFPQQHSPDLSLWFCWVSGQSPAFSPSTAQLNPKAIACADRLESPKLPDQEHHQAVLQEHTVL